MKEYRLPKFKAKANEPLMPQVYSYLRTLIIQNKLQPGMQLSENDLAAHCQVSRQPVHDALARLSQDNLIEIRPQIGSFIKKISVTNLNEVCFIRASVECNAVRESVRLTQSAHEKIISKLNKNLEQQRKVNEKSGSFEKFLALDDTFHSLICSFSETTMAWELIQSIKGNMDRIRFFTFAHISRIGDLVEEHQQIVDAIKNNDLEKSCALLHTHLYVITSTYRLAMQEREGWFLNEDVKAFKKARRRERKTEA